ncbi:MAG TPA: hypothetical protein EYO37_05460 [Nitrospina sp.]|nr:hypothetical protein [Nitrospina sp.]
MVRISCTISPFKPCRHFAATFLVDAGAPIEIIKDFMGHQNISTTMIYAKIKTDTLKKVGLAFEQSRVSTRRKWRQVKYLKWVAPRGSNPCFRRERSITLTHAHRSSFLT